MEGYVGIFDMDPEYRVCLMRGLMGRNGLQLPMVEFTKPDSIPVFAKEKQLKLLIISDMALTQEVLDADIEKIILLTEEPVRENIRTGEKKPLGHIFKYQPVGEIAGQLLYQYELTSPSAADVRLYQHSPQASVYGIYSPVKRCLKSSFSIALAQLLGEQQPTLLLSFEANSALLAMLDLPEAAGEANLSDALYYYLQGTISDHKEELVSASHSFDFISPVKNPEDVEELLTEDVEGFIRYFARECHYSSVVIDFGDSLRGINRILSCCSRIFMPVKSDWISEKKKEHYLDYVGRTDLTLRSRFQEVRPPYHHIGREGKSRMDGNFGWLVSGEFYDYVRQCL